MNIESQSVRMQLRKEGYTDIHEYSDPANEFFPMHDHEGDQRMIVLGGTILVEVDGEERNLLPGQELFIPARVKHQATVGPEGCEYMVGEKAA